MREGIAQERGLGDVATRPAARRFSAATAAAALLLTGCSGDEGEPAANPGDDIASGSSASTSSSASPSDSSSDSSSGSSSSATSDSGPSKPDEPRFRGTRAGKQAFVSYIIDGWSYALQTNDASVLLAASGTKPCRGCGSLNAELRQRKEEGWSVPQFPGAEVRKVTFRRDGAVEVATATVDIPASQSFFDDGTFRNDNKARKRVPFLVDLRADGRGKKRSWTLLAFSIK